MNDAINTTYYENLNEARKNTVDLKINAAWVSINEGINSASKTIKNWLFILNSGGLVALSAIGSKASTYVILTCPAIFFTFGLSLILVTVILEWFRFKSIEKKFKIKTKEFYSSNISSEDFSKIEFENKKMYRAIFILIPISFIFFVLGFFILLCILTK